MADRKHLRPSYLQLLIAGFVVALLLDFLALGTQLVKIVGAPFLFLPDRLRIIERARREEVQRLQVDSDSWVWFTIGAPGRYAVYTEQRQLDGQETAVREGDRPILVDATARRPRPYDPYFVRGRQVLTFQASVAGAYRIRFPAPPHAPPSWLSEAAPDLIDEPEGSWIVEIVPDYITGHELLHTVSLAIQWLLVGYPILYLINRVRAARAAPLASAQAARRERFSRLMQLRSGSIRKTGIVDRVLGISSSSMLIAGGLIWALAAVGYLNGHEWFQEGTPELVLKYVALLLALAGVAVDAAGPRVLPRPSFDQWPAQAKTKAVISVVLAPLAAFVLANMGGLPLHMLAIMYAVAVLLYEAVQGSHRRAGLNVLLTLVAVYWAVPRSLMGTVEYACLDRVALGASLIALGLVKRYWGASARWGPDRESPSPST